MIKKSVLNSFSQYNVPKMALALLVALLVGEVPGPWALVGAAVVLGGVAAWCWNGRPKKNGKESA